MAVTARAASSELAHASPAGDMPTSNSSASPTTSPSLLSRVRRRISTCRRGNDSGSNSSSSSSLASLGRAWLKSSSDSTTTSGGGGLVDEPKPYLNYTIAPPEHRENTAMHAVMDSWHALSIGSLHAPNLPSFPFSLFSNGNSNQGADEDEEDSEDDGSMPPTPPAGARSAPSSRRPSGSSPSLSPPPPRFGRRSSDPKVTGAGAADPIERLYGNVVMLGGYRGSVLRDAKTRKRLWIPLKVGFGFRKADLGLGLEEEDELRSAETVIATSMLAQVGGWIDLGKKLKERLKQTSHAQLHPSNTLSLPFSPPPSPPAIDPLRPPLRFHSWGYDWRRSLELPSAELIAFLEGLKRESAARGEGPNGEGLGATVIAHSMGGLVVLHALAKASDPTIFRGIVFAGTPFQGCINTLGPLRLGGGVAFNAKIGSPDICFSWRSGFYFLPRPPAEVAAITPRTSLETGRPSLGPAATIPSASPAAPPPTNHADALPAPVGAGLHISTDMTRDDSETTETPVTLPPSSPDSMPLPSLLTGCFEDPSGNPIQVDLFSPQTWATHELSPVPAGMDFSRPNAGIKRPRQRRRETDGNAFPLAAGLGNLGERKNPLGDVVQDAMEGAAETVEALSPVADDEDQEDGRTPPPKKAASNAQAGTAQDHDDEEARLAAQAEEVDVVHRYLSRTLGRARQFQKDLVDLYDPAKADRYPPMTIITSRKTPTVRGVLVTSREDIAQEGYDRLLWAEGDGIVLYESATRLPGDPELDGRQRTGDPVNDRWHAHLKGIVETNNGHVGMLGDLEGVRKCFELLYGPATART